MEDRRKPALTPRRRRLDIPRWLIVVLVGAPLFFTGAGIYALVQGHETDNQICESVQSVRDDLVTALKKIEKRALSNATTPEEKKAIKDAYEKDLIGPIGRPQCS